MPDVDVWIVHLDAEIEWPPPTAGEADRAARFVSEPLRRRYLRSHAALRVILRSYTSASPDFSLGEHGKPYLAAEPALQFNLSHSGELALVAVARETEIGVDVEHFRPMRDCMAIAERFFPPLEAAALAEVPAEHREVEFHRRWTRIEARLKATGIGLYGASAEPEGDWSVVPLNVGNEYAASVAARCGMLTPHLRNYPA